MSYKIYLVPVASIPDSLSRCALGMRIEQNQTTPANELVSEKAILHSPQNFDLKEVIGVKLLNKNFL
jgi:hypothetical protein